MRLKFGRIKPLSPAFPLRSRTTRQPPRLSSAAISAAAVLLAFASTSVRALPCEAENPYCYKGNGYASLEEAEHALRNPTEPSGKPGNGNWRYFFELKEQVGNRYIYHLPPKPHLPNPAWTALMPNGDYVWGWRTYRSPPFHTWQEAEQWMFHMAKRPTHYAPHDMVSDNLLYRGSWIDASGNEHREYSHNYAAVPVTAIDFTAHNLAHFYQDFNGTPGVEEAKISKNFHTVYKRLTTPGPSVEHIHGTRKRYNGIDYHSIALPVIDVFEITVGLCEPPYQSDGIQCVSDLEENIFHGPQYVLEPPVQPTSDCKTNRTNPCNPANGVKTQVEVDYRSAAAGGLEFVRYYSSRGPYKTDKTFQTGWRHTYSRRIDEEPDIRPRVSFASPKTQSSFYYSAQDACTSGWEDIKATVWSGDLATATSGFAGGNVCRISMSGGAVAYFPVRAASGFRAYTPLTNIKTLSRPDGSSIVFEFDGNDWINYLNPTLTLEAIGSTWVFTDADDTRETYDSAGRLITIATREGLVTTLDHDQPVFGDGDSNPDTLDTVTGPFGHKLILIQDQLRKRLAQLKDPSGNDTIYRYGNDFSGYSNLVEVEHPDQTKRFYHYEKPGLRGYLTGITDENGDRFATWDYDSAGRAILSEHAGGRERVTLTYNADGSTTMTDAKLASQTYHFSTAQGRRKLTMVSGDVCATCGSGNIAARSFDANGFIYEATDWNGNTTQTVRNSRGLTETLTEAKGSSEQRTTTTRWHPTWRLPTSIVSPRSVTAFAYDARGNLETLTVSGGSLSREWNFSYNANGQPLTLDGPRTDVADITTLTYNDCVTGWGCGQVKTITNAAGHVTTYNAYNRNAQVTRMTDANGLVTEFEYDARHRLVSLRQKPMSGASRTTRMSYDDAGQLATLSTPDGMVLTYVYSAAHYLTSIMDNLGNRVDYDYDAMGNRTSEKTYDASGTLRRAMDYAYDLNNRLNSITNGGHLTTLTMDLLGNLTDEVDPGFASTQHIHDALNRLDQTIDALSGSIDYDYDNHDNLTAVTAANGALTTYGYDELDNLIRETSPDRGITTYTYDEAGNIKTRLDARGTLTSYDYDALNRVTLETLNNGSTLSYEYDNGPNAIGRRTRIVDGSGQTSWTYNNFGQVTGKTQVVAGASRSTTYGYDNQGRLTTITLPSGKTLTYGHNAFQPSSVSLDGQLILSGATYEPFGASNGWTWADGSSRYRSFDLRGLETESSLGDDTRSLSRDAVGQVTALQDAWVDFTYDYDPLGRLTSFQNLATGGGGTPGPMFSSTPALLATIQTMNNGTGTPHVGNPAPWLTTAVRNVTASGAQLALGRAEVASGNVVTDETIGYVAIESGITGSFNANNGSSIAHEAQVTTDAVRGWDNGCYATNFAGTYSSSPLVIGTVNRMDGGDGGWVRRCSLNTGAVGFTIDEDIYRDTERSHTTEAVGFAAFSREFDATFSDSRSTWRMEVASTTLGSTLSDPTAKTVTFRQSYNITPVVVVLATSQGSGPAAIRIRNVTMDGFEAVQVTPANEDGAHAAMTMHYLAIEPGTHELPDGTRVLAGTVNTSRQQHGGGVTGSESWHSLGFASWPGSGGGSLFPSSQLFTYDANANRTSLTEDGNYSGYVNLPGSNRLLGTAGPVAGSYTYDPTGNVLSDRNHRYDYDDRGRLTAVDGGVVTYVHNALGQRISKTVGGVTTLFAYDEAGNLIGEYDGAGNPIKEHVWFDGAPVAVIDGSDVHLVHTDHLGTPRVITHSGKVVWRWDSDPFGSSAPQEDPDGDSTLLTYNPRFPGQYFDAETGMHYNYFRTYNPSTGGYLESDPLGIAGGLNTYGYALQNPLRYTDPFGLTPGKNEFLDCLTSWVNMHPENCFAKLLADIGAATAKYIATEACETTTCVAFCAVDSFVGSDPNSVMISASGRAAELKIYQIAQASYGKAAAQAVSRAIGWPMHALAAGQTLHCSLKCE